MWMLNRENQFPFAFAWVSKRVKFIKIFIHPLQWLRWGPVDSVTICRGALFIRDDSHVCLQECWRLGPLALRGGVAPPDHCGQVTRVQWERGCGQTDGGCLVGEVDRGRKRQDGEVEVGGVVVVARVMGYGGDVVPVRHGVRGVVLAHHHLTQCA